MNKLVDCYVATRRCTLPRKLWRPTRFERLKQWLHDLVKRPPKPLIDPKYDVASLLQDPRFRPMRDVDREILRREGR